MSLFDLNIKEIEHQLHKQEITVQELVDTSYNRIKEVDGHIKAFLSLNEDEARELARKMDETGHNTTAKLFGIPSGIKDNIAVKGQPLTCASQFLKNFNDPLYNAKAIVKLQDEQAISIGKLNLDEFAMGSSNENSSFTPTRNPWDLDRVPGGSSGGSAAAVASGEVLFALGSDTGGSIRQPASYCGIVGMKPTYGRVSRYGLVAFASSLDQIGPLTRRVEDNARVLEVIAGHDPMDSTSANLEVPAYSDNLNADVNGLKIAVPKEYLGEGVSQEVKNAIMEALKTYESMGATWEKVSLPHSQYAVAAYYLLSSSEASANLARFDGVRYGVRSEKNGDMMDMFKRSRSEGFGDEVKRRIMLGTFALSSGYYDAYYRKAQQVRTLVKQDFEKILNDYDVMIGPTAPTTAFKVGEKIDDPLTMYANDILTIPVNLAGNPALSVPAGFSKTNLPIGLQIIGRPFEEETVYQTAYAYEQATKHYLNKPQIGGDAS